MNSLLPKRRSVRLARDSYAQLLNQVLRRDGWRCQACGAMFNLEVHHQQFRSRCGDDVEHNLITLCVACHTGVHSG